MRKALLDSFLWRGLYFVTSLVLNIVIARIYEASQSGWIYFISNNFYMVLLVGGLGLDAAMTYFSASNRVDANRLASFSLLWPLVVALLSMMFTAILIAVHVIESNIGFLLFAGFCYTLGISLTNFFTALFYARRNFLTPNLFMSIINVVVSIAVPLFTSEWLGLDRENFLYVYFLQFLLQGAGLGVFYFLSCPGKINLQLPLAKELRVIFRFAIVALSANIAYYLMYRVDYIFVEAWCSSKSLGNYVQVSKMGQLMLIVPSIISGAIYPEVAGGKAKNVVPFMMGLMALFIMAYLIIILVAWLFSNSFFLWLFGNSYNEMFMPFTLLLPGTLFLSLHALLSAFFSGVNKVSINVVSTAAGLLVVLAGDILLIKPFGIAGAAFVSSFGYAVAFFVSMVIFVKRTNADWRRMFSFKNVSLKTVTSLFALPSTHSQ